MMSSNKNKRKNIFVRLGIWGLKNNLTTGVILLVVFFFGRLFITDYKPKDNLYKEVQKEQKKSASNDVAIQLRQSK